MYVKAILPSSKNSSLSSAILCNSNLALVLLEYTLSYICDTFTPFSHSSATNLKVSAVTVEYLNPPVSVIIPAKMQVPISLVTSIPK